MNEWLRAGRWLIYTAAPGTAADYDGLDSDNSAIWKTTYPTAVPRAATVMSLPPSRH